MPNQVNKKLKVVIDVDGYKNLTDIQTAIKLTEDELVRQTKIAERCYGAVKTNAEARKKQQEELLDGLKEQEKVYKKIAAEEDKIERKRIAREQAQKLLEKRAVISEARKRQDLWMRPSVKGFFNEYVSPVTKWRRELERQRYIEDEMTTLSVKGETEEVRADAAAKASAAKAAGGKAARNLAGAAAVSAVWKGLKTIGNGIKDTFQSILGSSISIKGMFRDILNDVSKITDMYTGMATYSANSLIVNSTARNTQLKYGMTGRQAYAFSQASEMFGVRTDEDLFYMTGRQAAAFRQYMQKQEEWYSKLESSGVLEDIQEMQLDFKLFKQELSVDFLQWMGENKDVIMTVAKGTLTVLKGLMQVLAKIFTLFGIDYSSNSYGFTSAGLSDSIAANSVSNNNSRTVKITSTNNVNGVFNQPQMEEFLNEKLNETIRSAAVALS